MPLVEAGSVASLCHFLSMLPNLEVLNLSSIKFGHLAFGSLCRALQKSGSLTTLRHLYLSSCGLSAVEGQELASLLWVGACPNIETLDLASNFFMGDYGLIPVLIALEGMRCPNLMSLCLDSTGLTLVGAEALAHVLSSPGCRQLQHLSLRYALSDRLSSLAVVKVVAQGSLPSLTSLDMLDTQMDSEHHRLLKDMTTSAPSSMLKTIVH